MERPNKAEHEKAVAEITASVEALKNDRKVIQDQIDAKMNGGGEKGGVQDLRSQAQALRSQKGALIDQKKAMRAKLDAARSESDKLIKDKKDTRSQIKFNSVEEIDKEIAKLKRIQETTTMSLNEEKRIIKEMDQLSASKSLVAGLKSKDGALDNVKEEQKSIKAQMSAKDKEIDAVSAQIDEIMTKIREITDKDTSKRDALQGLFKKRDEFKKKIGEKLKERDALKDDFREKNNTWYNYMRAVKAQKKIQYEKEKAERDAERAAYEAKLAEEEAKKIPYEAEQALCDYLADYLERTYLAKPGESSETKTSDVVAVKEDPFAGMKAIGKKDEEEIFFGKGKGKKKRVRASKKQDAAAAFTLSVDTFEQFGLLQLNPPTSVDQVESSVKALREKKEWYKKQPRGSVPTANDIRKANEKEVAKLRKADTTPSAPAPPKKGAFSLANEEFVPLGAGNGNGALNESWGKPSS